MNSTDALNQCEMEPLAHSGLIQPHGVLFYIDKASKQFQCVSANAAELIGEEPIDLLGTDGKDWLEQNLPDLVALPSSAGKRMHLPASLDMGFGELDVLVSGTSGGWIVEFERTVPAADDLNNIHLIAPAGPMNAEKLTQLQQSLVNAIAKTTGYDRVMLYQFHPDWSGEVLAEAADQVQGSYLGLRFPASDIPAIARNLYAQTPYRHIPDSSAKPVPLLVRQGSAAAMDLTWSDMRSVSPVHMEYLSNMRVGSSFSVSIMVDGKLWGLVACHHSNPRVIPLMAREHAKDLVESFVQTYAEYRNIVRRDLYAALEQAMVPLRQCLDNGMDLNHAISQQKEVIASLTGTAGGALSVGNQIHSWDIQATSDSLETVHQWCLKTQAEPVFFVDNLPQSMSSSSLSTNTCGVLGLSVRAKRLNNTLVSLYLFRPEESSEIAWAGNPNKPIEKSGNAQHLSPRQSFDRWVEVRNGYSRAWEDDVRFVGQQMREFLTTAL